MDGDIDFPAPRMTTVDDHGHSRPAHTTHDSAVVSIRLPQRAWWNGQPLERSTTHPYPVISIVLVDKRLEPL